MPRSSPTQSYEQSALSLNAGLSQEERDELITSHLSKVKYIADRMSAKLPPSVEKDDLYGAGVLGLIDAVERFDATRGIAFTTFAEMRVRGAILDSLRALDWASRSARRRAREIQDAFSAVEQQKGRSAREEEVAEFLNIPLSEFHAAMNEIRGLTLSNLDEPDEDTGLSLLDTVTFDGRSPLERFEYNERRRILSDLVDELPEKERKVIALYYLEELNMKEIGIILDVSESRVSQLRTQAIIRLRNGIKKLI
ncbi:MAG: FliA/WhiG family RNA polymerase sigma factor [Pyrinomonadaceae bacterium]